MCIRDRSKDTSFSLSAIEEHYLKRELLKYQFYQELEQFNDKNALRHFGYPFTNEDPKQARNSKSAEGDSNKLTELIRLDAEQTDFPMSSYILRNFVMTFPLLSKNMAVDESFWQNKVQVFFEHFMGLGFSESYDREEMTKRKKISTKLTKIILLLFNSGIGSLTEKIYYTNDKFILEKENARQRSNIEAFALPTKETLQYLVTNETVFINDWDINVVAVVKESELFNKDKRTPISLSLIHI